MKVLKFSELRNGINMNNMHLFMCITDGSSGTCCVFLSHDARIVSIADVYDAGIRFLSSMHFYFQLCS